MSEAQEIAASVARHFQRAPIARVTYVRFESRAFACEVDVTLRATPEFREPDANGMIYADFPPDGEIARGRRAAGVPDDATPIEARWSEGWCVLKYEWGDDAHL